MSNQAWGRYVKYVIGSDDQTKAAARVGVSQPTIGRWLAGKVPNKENVALFSQVYGRNPVEGFVAAGILTADMVGRSLNKESRDLLADLFDGKDLAEPPDAQARRRGA